MARAVARKAAKLATKFTPDLALSILPSLRSIFMDVAGLARKSKGGGASAASATEATQALVSVEGGRDRDDGELDSAGFLGSMYLAPAMMPRPTPRPRVRRRRQNMRSMRKRLRAFLDPPAPKARATTATPDTGRAGGKSDRRNPSKFVPAPDRHDRGGTGNKGPPPPATTARPVPESAAMSKFAQGPPEETSGKPSAPTRFMREGVTKKPDAEKIRHDFNHPKPPWMR